MIKIRFLASFGIFAFVHHKTATGLYLGVLELNLRVSVADECSAFWRLVRASWPQQTEAWGRPFENGQQ